MFWRKTVVDGCYDGVAALREGLDEALVMARVSDAPAASVEGDYYRVGGFFLFPASWRVVDVEVEIAMGGGEGGGDG